MAFAYSIWLKIGLMIKRHFSLACAALGKFSWKLKLAWFSHPWCVIYVLLQVSAFGSYG